jgi:hypothetical protein
MDLSLVANATRRVGAAAELRPAIERLAINTRLLLPLLAPQAGGASTELARDLRAAVAGRDSVVLVLPPTAAQSAAAARLEIGNKLFLIPPALRDALLAALGNAPGTPAATTRPTAPATPTALAALATNAQPAADAGRAWAVAATTTASAAVLLSGSGATRAVQRARDDGPAPTVRFTQPLFEPVNQPRPIQALADTLRHNVERSGLFLESHIARWAQGGHDTAEMRAEALRVLATSANLGGEMTAQRVAAQVAVMQEGALTLRGPAWPGQELSLVLEREANAGEPTAAEPVFCARLMLDMPNLGPVEVELRLSGAAISAKVSSQRADHLAPALSELADRLHAQGMLPVLLQSVPATEVH